MKRIKIFLFAFAFLFVHCASAQNPIFLTQGKIEFEKKINIYAQMQDDNDDGWKDWMKKNMPQFKSTYFNLTFGNGKTLYQPGRENPENNKIWYGNDVADDNIVYSDFNQQQSVSQKKAFEKIFLVQDSVRKIKWKITNETRNIAGFECRRANAIIMDSIYVVAFYTDEIVTPGGPESFAGLPGMILGIALAHEHTTWFATKIYSEDVHVSSIIPPSKGKKVTNASMFAQLKDGLKDWGKWGNRYIKAAML